jgi:hypothetical protein
LTFQEAQKIREAFAILTQGVEMVHYDIRGSKKAGIPSKKLKIVWMVRQYENYL